MRATYEVLHTAASQPSTETFARDVREGLSRRPKSIPSAYFYDDRGSRLFQRITELEEYYPTRCEREILVAHAPEIAAIVADGPFRLVELGAGDGRKTEVLLRALLETGREFEYVPIDISHPAIVELTATMPERLGHGALRMHGIVAEYFDALDVLRRQASGRSFVLFLGSNIGNFSHRDARRFLRGLRDALRPGDYALVGFDLKKDLDVLQLAYNDTQSVTREFNLNLLDRINRELGGRFDRRRFTHHAAYNARRACMESWLISREDQRVPIRALRQAVRLRAWEGIHVECSYKYDVAQVEALAAAAGFRVRRHFFDARRYFVDSLWQAAASPG